MDAIKELEKILQVMINTKEQMEFDDDYYGVIYGIEISLEVIKAYSK